MADKKLKPCPFCGSAIVGWPFINAQQGLHLICCSDCGAQGPVKTVPYDQGFEAAKDAWNERKGFES